MGYYYIQLLFNSKGFLESAKNFTELCFQYSNSNPTLVTQVITKTKMTFNIPKQVILIKDLSTKSVILYPSRAHIVRDINDVMLKPGPNEIEIYGLTPTVDEHSIQIEGRGAATIVDMTIDLVPNRDIFEEVYPEESDESSSESEYEYADSDDEVESVSKISKELKDLRAEAAEAVEMQNSANQRLVALDMYAKSVAAEHNAPDDVSELLEKYETDRLAIYKVHTSATKAIEGLNKRIARKENEKLNAGRGYRKEKKDLMKQKEKDRRRKELHKAERKKEAKHTKQERLRYWPKKVYKVTLQLETASTETPSSSRRGSVDSITLAQSPPPEPGKAESATETIISLSLSYVTKEAGWSPRYDLKISSLQKSAMIVYRTEFLNRTGETWKDTKLTFSTSQTSYQGLDDVVPFMHAWRVKLGKYGSGEEGLLSTEEAQKPRSGRPTADTFNRSEVFGVDENYVAQLEKKFAQQTAPPGVSRTARQIPQAQTSMAFGGFGSTTNMQSSHSMMMQQPQNAWGTSQVLQQENRELDSGIQHARGGRKSGGALLRTRHRSTAEGSEKEERMEESYDPTIEDSEYSATVKFEESVWEDSGLTATYDVPGARTLTPSSMTRRHKIVSLNAANIHLSHICVPKLRAAAFLRAKIRNPSSSVTLLKGSAGVTLDGSFLGNMTLPRVSPGQLFDLPLGVDPGIHINYPKPSVHRSTQGIMFNKESAQVFTRSIWLNNTKPTPIELLVIDQVPVSEDERLKIVITEPKGLAREGDSVKAGTSAKAGSSGSTAVMKGSSWGHALAKMKKNGEINWTVNLEKGQACLLKLDYEARLPQAEKIVPA